MGDRVRAARDLGSWLSDMSGHDVKVCYERGRDHYKVLWDGGPSVGDMESIAQHRSARSIELGLDISRLHWERRSETDAL